MAEVRKGTKFTEDEEKNLDPKNRVLLQSGPDVEGQDVGNMPDAQGRIRVECPWCGNVGRAKVDTDYYKYFGCNSCGRAFRA